MAKKAVKRPDEVEYIEFKGRENFKEVCEFIGISGELITNEKGIERLLLQRYKFDKDVRVPTGTIFYKWNNYGKDVLNYGETSWAMTSKDDFFKRYKEDTQ